MLEFFSESFSARFSLRIFWVVRQLGGRVTRYSRSDQIPRLFVVVRPGAVQNPSVVPQQGVADDPVVGINTRIVANDVVQKRAD